MSVKGAWHLIGFCALFVGGLGHGAVAADQKDCQEQLTCPSSWVGLADEDRKRIFAYAENYKVFISKARTELTFVEEAVKIVRAAGFRKLGPKSPMTAGAKYYDVNRDRALALIAVGQDGMKEGFQVVAAHIDSPRLELKGRPLYEDGEFVLFQTNFHGGIKPQQWTNIPLALIGRVDKKDGTTIQISVGLDPKDPTFVIAEVAPHTDRGYRSKKVEDHMPHEKLDPLVGHIPNGITGKGLKSQVIAYLAKTYGITPADLVSAELALVPAMPPRDVGFDRGLVAAHGQDDILASYAALRAIIASKDLKKTAIAYLVDNEEVGNVNNTGAKSDYFTDLLRRLLRAKYKGRANEFDLHTALRKSRMISVDVNPGVNPMNPGAWEKGNAPRLGYGVNLKLYGRGFNANSEYIAQIRNMLDQNNISWQTSTYKVGRAGGGTIGSEFSRQNMDVIDFGIPVLSIHTPYEISSKVDLYSLYRSIYSFFNS